MGNLVLDPSGNVVVTDEGDNRVYRINANGRAKPIAGNGYPGTVQNGRLALKCGLEGVRGIWFLPNSGYLLATQGGSQIIYVDPDREAYVFLDGSPDGSHEGDGA